MTATVHRARGPWEDRFCKPTPAQLRGHYANKQLSQLADHARAEVGGLAGVSESIAWHGLPWRWSWVYAHERAGGLPLAYLIPDPQRPQIAAPLSAAMVERLPLKSMKRFIREGLAQARVVAGVYWPSWDVSVRSQLDEVLELVVRKHRVISPAGEAVATGT